MKAIGKASARAQSPGEELANSASHGAGLVGAIVGTPFLIVSAVRGGDTAFIVGASVFCAAMILLYSASTMYHALQAGALKRLFLALDHSAILLLIAGSYTPFTLGVLRETAGWQLFAAVWTLALVGLTLRAIGRGTHPVITTGLYLAMGWLVLLKLDALIAAIPPEGVAWLVGGGLSYSLGLVFFVLDARIRYAHAIWHAFVVGGTACHFFAVLWYAA